MRLRQNRIVKKEETFYVGQGSVFINDFSEICMMIRKVVNHDTKQYNIVNCVGVEILGEHKELEDVLLWLVTNNYRYIGELEGFIDTAKISSIELTLDWDSSDEIVY